MFGNLDSYVSPNSKSYKADNKINLTLPLKRIPEDQKILVITIINNAPVND